MKAISLFSLFALVFLAGCETTAINKQSENTFLSADDAITMTDRMAQAITGDADVAAVTREKPMIIVVKPIANETNWIIRGNEKELYTNRIRGLLATKQVLRNQFTFVLNRADYEKLQAKEGLSEAQLGPVEGRIQPEYALWGTFYAATDPSGKQRTDAYLCVFKLTRISGPTAGEILWEGSYETKKSVTKRFLD